MPSILEVGAGRCTAGAPARVDGGAPTGAATATNSATRANAADAPGASTTAGARAGPDAASDGRALITRVAESMAARMLQPTRLSMVHLYLRVEFGKTSALGSGPKGISR